MPRSTSFWPLARLTPRPSESYRTP